MKVVARLLALALCLVLLAGQVGPIPGMGPLIFSAFGVKNSLVLNGSNQYLNRTFGTPTSSSKWTMAVWVKRGATGAQTIFAAAAAHNDCITFGTVCAAVTVANAFAWDNNTGSSIVSSNAGSTDTTNWHHYCVQEDVTQATAANRLKLFVDNVEVTYQDVSYPALNTPTGIDSASTAHTLGQIASVNFLNAKVAEFYFIDGQAVSCSSFVSGSGAGTTHPIAYSGTYGSNGVYLNFQNSGALGTDSSGNGNTFTTNNSPTQSTDVPS